MPQTEHPATSAVATDKARPRWRRRLLLGCAIGTAGLLAATVAGPLPASGRQQAPTAAAAGLQAKTTTRLLLKYRTEKPCKVHLNYPEKAKGNGTPWSVPVGQTVVWRYNVNKKWALISYPARKRQSPPQGGFPWWGFTERSCLGGSVRQPWKVREYRNAKGEVVKRKVLTWYPAGRPVPGRILEGRSRKTKSKWRRVYFNEGRARIERHRVRTRQNATLRDRHNFVIGNVPAGWRVHVTERRRGGGHWVKVRVPNTGRWGFIERRVLPGRSAATAPRGAVVAAPQGRVAAGCHWTVVWPSAGVYEEPTRSGPALKTKRSGESVGPYCNTYRNAAENETYVMVYTAAAADGLGWMRRDALKPA